MRERGESADDDVARDARPRAERRGDEYAERRLSRHDAEIRHEPRAFEDRADRNERQRRLPSSFVGLVVSAGLFSHALLSRISRSLALSLSPRSGACVSRRACCPPKLLARRVAPAAVSIRVFTLAFRSRFRSWIWSRRRVF